MQFYTSNCSCNLFCASIWHKSASAIGISLYAKEKKYIFRLRFFESGNLCNEINKNDKYPCSWLALKELELVPVECIL